MAIGWLTALKAVPWADVVQAAPHIVQGARKLFTAAKSARGPGVGDETDQAGSAEGSRSPDGRFGRLGAHIETLQAEQRASAELIRSLAEQNASIVAALDLLRKRIRILTGVSIALVTGLTLIALAMAMN